jgi:uncharacterized protein YdaU (DUF1376 family)
MNNLHWMKLYIGDELSNTSHMTPAEFGSYIYLKMHYWRFGCLPIDDERLARIAKVSPDLWRDILPSIGPLFDENWRDPKLEEQRTEAEDRHRKLSEAGKRGGRPRKEEKGGLKPGFSGEKAWPKQPEPEPEPDSYPAPQSKSDPEVRALDTQFPQHLTGFCQPARRRRWFEPFKRETHLMIAGPTNGQAEYLSACRFP